jgi:outer membrane protein
MEMKKFIGAAALAVSILGATAAGAADGPKLGVLDIQKVLQQSDSGKAAKEQLVAKISKYEGEKNSREDELKKLKAELEKQNIILNDSARNAKEKDYQQKLKEYQRFIKDVNDELQGKDEELKNRLIEETLRVSQEYGRKNGFTFIFVKSEMLVYQDEKVDVTDDIVKLLNSKKNEKK